MLQIKRILSILIALGAGFIHSQESSQAKKSTKILTFDPSWLKLFKNGRLFVLNTKKLPGEYKKLKAAINNGYSKCALEMTQKELDKIRECKGGFEERANLVLETIKHVVDNLGKISRESVIKVTLDEIKSHKFFQETELKKIKVGDPFIYISDISSLQMVEILRLESSDKLSRLQFSANRQHLEPLSRSEENFGDIIISEYVVDIISSNAVFTINKILREIRSIFVDPALKTKLKLTDFESFSLPLSKDLSQFKRDAEKYSDSLYSIIEQSLSTLIPSVFLAKHKKTQKLVLVRTLGLDGHHPHLKCEYVVLKDGEFVSATQKESAKFVEENSDKLI